MIIDWNEIDTVLLDMDGTLLDLHFDNVFWQQHVPASWGRQHGLSLEQAHAILTPRFREVEGTLSWYCLDFWSRELGLDVLALKDDLQHLIGLRPHVESLLRELGSLGKRRILVTNAHPKVLDYKLVRTGLGEYFDTLVSAHEFDAPKESPEFWPRLQARYPFDKQSTLLIDDNARVLASARDFGIGHLLGIVQPDSQRSACRPDGFSAIDDFRDLFAGLDNVVGAEHKITD